MDRSQLLNDAEEAMRVVLDGRQSGIWTATPGIIQSVDTTKWTCSVQPAIKGSVEDENGAVQSVNLPLLINVPIVFPGGGGYVMTFPLAAGDEVLVIFASRCIDAWWQSGGSDNEPMEARMHDLSDGFAIPGPRSQPKVSGPGSISTAFQIRNENGDGIVQIDPDGVIRLLSTGEVHIVAPQTVIVGSLVVTGDIIGDSLGTPINLATHKHISAIPGSPTGPAIP